MQIKVLPEQVASQIAAGEVIERPVSVVKELIENSIDAGATKISVRIEDAGKRLIDVRDSGSGIPSGEVRTAIKRYATSKISNIMDLDSVSTLGFRGEALASIASVSRLQITTKYAEETTGVSLTIEGGQEMEFSEVGNPSGTRILIQNLFYNVPARKKFLKSDITERRLISKLITQYALIYPDIRFDLEMEGKKVFLSSGNGNRREILSRIYDLDTSKQLLEMNFRREKIQVDGFISPLGITRSNRKEIRLSVNGRRVSNSMLTSAVLRAFHGYLMVGRFPIAILFIKLPADDLDVNVHPAKAEIKFRDEKAIFSAVHSAIRKTIAAYFPVPELPDNLWAHQALNRMTGETRNQTQTSFLKTSFGQPDSTEEHSINNQEEVDGKPSTSLLRLIGQLGQTYIAAEGPDGLYLIDQHAAHERILFEKMQRREKGKSASQLLLQPAVIEIPTALDETLKSRQKVLNSLGFELENFGPKTYKIVAIPAIISHLNPEEALRSSIEPDEDDKEFMDSRIEDMIITKICKRAAVKGGQSLSRMEQEELLRDLEKCESPRTCPHGRPTMIYLSVNSLERQFGRRGSI
jgi:DNA mismatch repair protein MutL